MRRASALRRVGWTAADEAELELVAWELSGALIAHRDRCRRCSELGTLCPVIADAVLVAGDWVVGRRLRSRAAYLRAELLHTRLARLADYEKKGAA